MDKNRLYQDLYLYYKQANPYKSGKDCQEAMIKFWKYSKKQSNFVELVSVKIEECKEKHYQRKKHFFTADSVSTYSNASIKDEKNKIINSFEPLDGLMVNTGANIKLEYSANGSDSEMKSKIQATLIESNNRMQDINSLNNEIKNLVPKKEIGLVDDEMEIAFQSK